MIGSLLRRRQCPIGKPQRSKGIPNVELGSRANGQVDHSGHREMRERVPKRYFRELSDHVRDHFQSLATSSAGHSF